MQHIWKKQDYIQKKIFSILFLMTKHNLGKKGVLFL